LHGPTYQNGMAWMEVVHGVGDLPQQLAEVHPLPDVLQSARLDPGDIQ
jgi:hypothetical protein